MRVKTWDAHDRQFLTGVALAFATILFFGYYAVTKYVIEALRCGCP
jgi:hypothetical protein